ncbi:VIN3-like protein 2 [Solanum pennellii]|uniref:VIN3-like protein 2 n=1 Tax=Solanum pennellii TaxID=28526 RepID=A0ABM1H9Z0_SOLPN|nr:VIN3-like protein 2 [Solanum pennellii]
MDASSFEGIALDPSKCSKLSMEEKRELVYELSKQSHGAPEMLQSWSRQEILQILCAEMGKERKYTGLTKLKIIENLLKIVSEKKSLEQENTSNLEMQPSSESGQRSSKRQRKAEHPSRFPIEANTSSTTNTNVSLANVVYCKNLACRAKLSGQDAFCKRCSCCICRNYDDNKDPSLWLICSSEPPFQGDSCGMSCHLECAMKHGKSCITTDKSDKGNNGTFYCVSCGKANDLLSSLKKQLIVARDTRRVDILCYRLSLSQKLSFGAENCPKLYEVLDEAVNKLEADVGPLTGLPVKMARGIVNRLSFGPAVQQLCGLAVEYIDALLSERVSEMPSNAKVKDCEVIESKLVRFEDVFPSSVTVVLSSEGSSMENVVGYTLWHRKAVETEYPVEPTRTLFSPNTRFVLSDLMPATDYVLKIVSLDSKKELGMFEVQFCTSKAENELSNLNMKSLEVERSQSPPTNCSNLSNPSSVEDETNNIVLCSNEDENRGDNCLSCCENTDKAISTDLCCTTIAFASKSHIGNEEVMVSLGDEEDSIVKVTSLPNTDAINLENKQCSDVQTTEETSTDNGSNAPLQTALEFAPFVGSVEAGLPITPCKMENVKGSLGRKGKSEHCSKDLDNGSGKEDGPQVGCSSKKRVGEWHEECAGTGDKDFEYYVKVVRWLECGEHIDKTFRQKFLTWYSLRATPQDVRIVKAFVDTLIEDPASLAGQLVDTFSDVISSKRASVVPAGFCLKLWH